MRAGLIASIVLVSAAAQAQQVGTPADRLKKYMDDFIGHPVSDYAFVHGPPTARFTLSAGRMVFQWEEHRVRQGVGASAQFGNTTIYKPAPTFNLDCRVSISAVLDGPLQPEPGLEDWSIFNWRADGNGCF
jgi:hypothetical protein